MWSRCPWSGITWMSRGYSELSLPLTGCDTLESQPHFSQEAALERIAPVPCPGSTIQLSRVAKAKVDQPKSIGMGEMTHTHSYALGWAGCRVMPSTPLPRTT